LSAEGYETVAFTDGGFVSSHHGFARGFDLFNHEAKQGYEAIRSQLPRQGDVEPEPGRAPFDRAIQFLSLRRMGRPLLLFLHSYGVHDYFKGHSWVEPDPHRREQAASLVPCLVEVNRCTERDWEILREWYRREVRRVGGLLQELLEHAGDELDDAPVAVFLVSDHGEAFDPTNGRIHHGGWLHPEFLRIPLWAQVPSEVGTVHCEDVVSLIDVAPTMLGIAKVARVGLPGRSLVDEGPLEEGTRSLYGEEHFYYWTQGRRRTAARSSSRAPGVAVIRAPHWAVLHPEEPVLVYRWESVNPEVTALTRDAEPILEELRWYRDRARGSSVEAVPLEEELRRRLEALGYVEIGGDAVRSEAGVDRH
jgi:arylsulfatase A-like enzyme